MPLTSLKQSLNKLHKRITEQKHDWLFNNHPKVFCNSFHKSGTQLLVTAAEGIPGIKHYNRAAFHHFLTKNQKNQRLNTTPESVIRQMGQLLQGEMMGGHVEYQPEIEKAIKEQNIKHLFIIRDPRDVVISNLMWWESHKEIDTWPYIFFRDLNSRDEKIKFLILGDEYAPIRNSKHYPYLHFPNLVDRYKTFLGWLNSPDCLVLKFEHLKSDPYQAFGQIYSWVWKDHPFSEDIYQRMQLSAEAKNSKTFRTSKTGHWKTHFSKAHLTDFFEIGGQWLLEALKYE